MTETQLMPDLETYVDIVDQADEEDRDCYRRLYIWLKTVRNLVRTLCIVENLQLLGLFFSLVTPGDRNLISYFKKTPIFDFLNECKIYL
jgi:hypothetical protein